MKKLLLNSKTLATLFLLLCLFFISNTFGQSGTVTSGAAGNWNTDATWVNINITRTGTVTCTTGSTTVTGTGTLFLTELTVGSVIQRTNGSAIGTVASISSNTSLILTANAGTNQTTQAYRTISGPPSPVDTVIVDDGDDVTVNLNSVCAALTIATGGTDSTLIISGTNSLTVNGTITINNGTGNGDNKIIQVGTGTLSSASIVIADTTNDNRDSEITISTGTVNVTGNITMSGSANRNAIRFSNSGTLNIGGTMTGGSLVPSTGTVNYNAAGNQTVGVYTYNNLTLSGSGTKTLTSVASITNNFTMSGTAIASAATALTIGGIVTLGSGTSFTAGSFTHNVAGNWVNNGSTFTSTGSTINMNGAAQSIGGSAATTFNNLTLAGSNTKTFGIATTISSALTINTSIVANLGTFTHSSNTLVLGGTGQLSGQYGGTTSGATYINITFFATATGVLNVAACGISGLWTGASGTSWATPGNWCDGIVPTAATNVTINSGGNQPIISAAAVCNAITLGSGSTLAINSTLGVSGNWTNNGSTVSGTGTVTLSGTATIGGSATTAFPNLTVSGTVTQGINTTVTGNFSQTAGTYNVSSSANSYTLGITGNFSKSGGTYNVSNGANNSAVTVGGTFGLSAGTFNLISNASASGATVTVTGVTTVSGTGVLDLESVSSTTGVAVFNANSDLTLTGTGTDYIDFGTGTSTNNAINIKGNFAKSGTGNIYVTSTGAVKGFVFDGTGTSGSPQTLSYAGTASTYHNYIVNSGTYVRLLTGLALGTATNPASTFTIDGTLDAQTFVISGSSTAGVKLNSAATLVTANTGGVTATITATTPTYDAAANYIFDGSANQNTGFSNTTMNNLTIANTGGTVTINTAAPTVNGTLAVTSGILNAAAFQIIGNASNPFTLASGTTFRLSGSYPTLFTAGNTTFNAASTVEYFGASQTVSGTPTYGNLNINQSSGTAVLGANTTLVGTLTLSAGLLNLSTFNLTLGSAAVAGTFSATRMIVSGGGELRRVFTADGSYVYPIGETTGTAEYSPVTLAITGSAYSSAQVGLTVSDAKHPNNNSATNFLTRSWSVNQSGITACTATVTGTYINTAADVTGTLGSIKAAQLNGTFNQATNPWVKTGGSVLSGTTLTYTGATLISGQTSVFTGITSADPTVAITGGGVTTCYSVNVSLGTTITADPTVIYSWSPATFLSSTTIANPVVTNPTATTTYSVTIIDGNGISVTSTSSTVTVSTVNTWTGGANTTSWTTTGNWSCGIAPISITDVVIGSASFYPEISSNVTINTLTLDSGTTLKVNSTYDLTVTDVIDNDGTVTLENNANLLQTNNVSNTGSGTTTVKRNSSLLKRLDYTLWSSPVTGQGLYAFSPFTFANRFYVYRTTTNLYNNADIGFSITGLNGNGVNGTDGPPAVEFATAKGYLIRMPWDHPAATATVWNGTFTGVPNNGDITYNMTSGASGFRFNLVGNPYPSPISMSQFVLDNSTKITGTLYFWRETNNNTSNNAYCSWAGGTFTTNGQAQVVDPSGIIRTGQGFIVEAEDSETVLSFNNGQRSSDNANQFFKNDDLANSTTSVETNRFWLNLTNTAGAFSQMAAGYMTDATDGVDIYDGKNINTGNVLLNSILNNEEYTIQGKSLPFNTADVIPLRYKITDAGNYTITLDHVDGLFTGGTQPIYVKDNLTVTYHDLNTGAYSFASEAGTFNDRFEIVYALPLGVDNPTFTENAVVIYAHNNEFAVNSGTIIMSSIKVFDIRGRLLEEKKDINANQTTVGSGLANEVLLVQITSEDGITVTKKVIR